MFPLTFQFKQAHIAHRKLQFIVFGTNKPHISYNNMCGYDNTVLLMEEGSLSFKKIKSKKLDF